MFKMMTEKGNVSSTLYVYTGWCHLDANLRVRINTLVLPCYNMLSFNVLVESSLS